MAQVLRSAFSAPMDDLVLRFVASVDDDRHLVACDVRGSQWCDVQLTECELSGARVSESELVRVEVTGGRAAGVVFLETILRHVRYHK